MSLITYLFQHEIVRVFSDYVAETMTDLANLTVCRVVHVVTYPEPQPHPTWSYGRGAPAHGSQAPFHQRYAHYKMYGYAGK